jgi:hypothetical protein
MQRHIRVKAMLLLAGALATGCGSSLALPPTVAPEPAGYAEVPYPPPAALVELVPNAPDDPDAVWIDGSWVWRGRYYVWQRGGWVVPPEGATFRPWSLRFTADGRMLFAKTRWTRQDGRRLRQPPILAPAMTPPNEVTAEFQTAR